MFVGNEPRVLGPEHLGQRVLRLGLAAAAAASVGAGVHEGTLCATVRQLIIAAASVAIVMLVVVVEVAGLGQEGPAHGHWIGHGVGRLLPDQTFQFLKQREENYFKTRN